MAPARSKTIFVAYPWQVYRNRDRYKRAYTALSGEFDVRFVFAEDRLSARHVLEKIARLIQEADFGIYDITSWNPNVTLEYGLATGLRKPAFITFNPEKTDLDDVPADVRGFDRLQYSDFDDLNEKLRSFFAQGPELDFQSIRVQSAATPELDATLEVRPVEVPIIDQTKEAAELWLNDELERLLQPLSQEHPPKDPKERSVAQYREQVTDYLQRAHIHLADEMRARAVGANSSPLQLVIRNNTKYNFSAAVLELSLPEGLSAFFSHDQARSHSLFPEAPIPWGSADTLTTLLGRGVFRPNSPPEDALIDNFQGSRVEFPPVHLRPGSVRPTRRLFLIADQSLLGHSALARWTISARNSTGWEEGEFELELGSTLLSPQKLILLGN